MTGSVDLDAQAGELGLVKGRTYPFDLFFAERHTTGSTFDMDTSIALLQPKPAPPPRKKP